MLAAATFLFIVPIIPDRGRNIWRAGGVLLVAFMATLPYVWPFLNYRSYFIEDVQHFAPHIVHFSFPLLVQSVIDAAGRDLFSDFWGGLYFLPLACWMFIKCRFRGLRILLCAYFLLTVFVNTGMKFTDQAFARMIYGFSIYWVMFLSPIGSEEWCDSISFRSMVCGGLFFVIFATVWIDRPAFLTWTTPRARNIASYNPALIQKITTLTGNLILLENQGGLNHATETSLGKESERWSDDVHLVGVVALETGKNIFAADIDGFPPSVFRTNTITSGTYKGRFLSEHPAAEISALLKNWGIKYLVLWSNEARDYFKSQQGNYKLVWRIDPTELQKAGFEPVPWEIYEFANADPRSVVISPGSGLVETKDYFTKILRLYGVQRGAKVIIRTNYFPAWRAFWGNHEIKLINEGGQLALLCPSDGDQVVYLHFPKYKSLTVLAFLALLLCLPLSLRGYL